MLEQKIRELLMPPPNEPEPLVNIKIIQGIQWYWTYNRNHSLSDKSKALIIADYIAGENKGYERNIVTKPNLK